MLKYQHPRVFENKKVALYQVDFLAVNDRNDIGIANTTSDNSKPKYIYVWHNNKYMPLIEETLNSINPELVKGMVFDILMNTYKDKAWYKLLFTDNVLKNVHQISFTFSSSLTRDKLSMKCCSLVKILNDIINVVEDVNKGYRFDACVLFNQNALNELIFNGDFYMFPEAWKRLEQLAKYIKN